MNASLSEIAKFLGSEITSDRTVTKVLSIGDTGFDDKTIGWCNDANAAKLESLESGNVIVSQKSCDSLKVSDQVVLIPVENPRRSFMKMLQEFFAVVPSLGLVAKSADIHESVIFNRDEITIAQNVVIGEGSRIGKGVRIGPNTVIFPGTEIGDNVTIGANCTIGGVGFGYELNEENEYELMPHIGNVKICDSVEIGNNTCIDRAVLGSTLIGKNVKIDNLVHIAHGVEIGENSLVIANAMVAGSVKIGANSWISPSSSIRQKLVIGDNSLVGMGSVVVKNVEDKQIVAGNPAKPFPQK